MNPWNALLVCAFLTAFCGRNAVGLEEPKILYENDPTLLTTSIQVVVLTGSADDPLNQTGLRSLLASSSSGNQDAEPGQVPKRDRGVWSQSLRKHLHDVTVFDGKVIKENTDEFLKTSGGGALPTRLLPKGVQIAES